MKQPLFKFLAMALATTALAACVQMPTEKQSVADLRPQISFRLNTTNPLTPTSRVILDGQDMGSAQEFIDGVNSLKVLPGTHQLQVMNGSLILLEERFYVADGVNKSFVVK
jgi:hypothetical protein